MLGVVKDRQSRQRCLELYVRVVLFPQRVAKGSPFRSFRSSGGNGLVLMTGTKVFETNTPHPRFRMESQCLVAGFNLWAVYWETGCP